MDGRICVSADQPKVFLCQASIRVLQSCVVNMSLGARHSWEAANVHMQSSQTVPELDEHDERWGADDVDDNDPKFALDLATQAFLDFVLDLTDESKISAKDVCVLCWYAPKAGMSDGVRRIGFRPDAPSEHYQRHLDSVLDFAERRSQFYKLQVVGTRKQDASRSTFDMCVVPGHEVFNAAVEGDAGLSERLCHAKTTNGLPQVGTSIQWSKETQRRCIPWSLTTWLRCPTR